LSTGPGDSLVSLYQSIIDAEQFRAVLFSERGDKQEYGTRSLDAMVRQIGKQLQDCGIGPGDVVLYQGHQSDNAFACFWATVLIGGIFAPVDPDWPAYLSRKALEKAKPECIIAAPGLTSFWQEAVSIPVLSTQVGIATENISDTDPAWHPPSLPKDTPAAYLFTSGSTGDPKAVILSHAALVISAHLAVSTFEWQTGEMLVNLAEPHTMSGLRNGFLAAPLAGMHWAYRPEHARQSIFHLIDFLSRSQPHRLVAAPVLLRHLNLLGHRLEPRSLQRLQALYCTGADLRNEDVKALYRSHGIPVINYYGLTETVGLCLSQSLQGWSPEDDSLGMAAGCEIKIDPPPSKAEDTGELLIRQRHPMTGYLNDKEATTNRFDGEWIRTGDLVSQRCDGSFIMVGRKDSFIKTSSTDRLYPQEVESVLESHHQVLEAACLGIQDRSGSEHIAALIVASPSAKNPEGLSKALRDYAIARLGPHRTPTSIRMVEALPRTSNGKLQRNHLKDLIDAN
jgi:acyl-coenzyme A synthetase/AMP-(fatty) acid ligase